MEEEYAANKIKFGFLAIVIALLVILPFASCAQPQNGNVVAPPDNNSQGAPNTPANQASAYLPAGQGYVAHLLGFEEVPRIDTAALGQAVLNPGADGTSLVCQLVLVNIQNVTAAHVHQAHVGQNGPVVATLFSPTSPATNLPGKFDGVLSETILTTANLEGPLAGQPLSALLDVINRGEAYVNVHTAQAPTGEIRGQIYLQDANNVVTTLTSIAAGTVTAISGNNISIQSEGRTITVIKDNATVISPGDLGPSAQLDVGGAVEVYFDPVTTVASLIELEKPGDILPMPTTKKVAGTVVSFSGLYLIIKDANGQQELVEVLTGTELQFQDGAPAIRTDIKPGVVIEATVKVGAHWAVRIEIQR